MKKLEFSLFLFLCIFQTSAQTWPKLFEASVHEHAELLVIASDGRMIRQVSLKNSLDQVVIELQNLPIGMYIIQLKNNHKMLGTGKFNIL